MSQQKINFTKDHEAKLKNLCSDMLFSGNTLKGLVGTELNVYDLIHNTTVNTLITINSNLKKEVSRIESLDEWSMNDYQQKKLAATKDAQELVNLLIGYRKYQDQIHANKAKAKELKAKYAELKKSTMSPEDQLKALESEIQALGDSLDEEENTSTTDSAQATSL